MTHHPLILITNDDGIASKGLRSAAEACDPLGEVLICAPTVQQSGTGRSMPPTSEGRIFPQDIADQRAHDHGLCRRRHARAGGAARPVRDRRSASGPRRVGHQLWRESGRRRDGFGHGRRDDGVGIVRRAVDRHFAGNRSRTLSGLWASISIFPRRRYFLRFFAQRVLEQGLPPKTRVLKIEIPRLPRRRPNGVGRGSSQVRYFLPVKPHRRRPDDPGPMGYEAIKIFDHVERDSDVWAVRVDQVVSVTPLSLDFTAPIDLMTLPK